MSDAAIEPAKTADSLLLSQSEDPLSQYGLKQGEAPSTTKLLELFNSEPNPHHGINLVRNIVLMCAKPFPHPTS